MAAGGCSGSPAGQKKSRGGRGGVLWRTTLRRSTFPDGKWLDLAGDDVVAWDERMRSEGQIVLWPSGGLRTSNGLR